ncbi:PREDICTED: uncharacterized protein LOC108974896 isoform X2 [Bactrocera latifrons]|uniref:uncharacterized protein LOC108974896 isoform X2 n=1 Tax=Bactrocera latifrons TaxID=174628 RepID=UPI0008DE82B8|nr:PREDICTED: uncharacterized protein LOC108974896 isoform X2 [Bactrocera latifrons]
MAKYKLCVFLALLCAAALLVNVTAEEVEARNDEVAPELPQPEAIKDLSKPLPAKYELSENPAIVPVEIEDKTDEEQSKPVGEGELAQGESVVIGAEDSKTENLERAMNAEILQQPQMARLARHLKSFHNYHVYRAQKAAGIERAANVVDGMEDDDGIVPEERAIRRRQRVHKRKTNNNVRRKHHRKNVANRLNSAKRQNQRVNSVRKRNTKKGSAGRRRVSNDGNKRRSSSNKKQRKSSTSNKRRSSKNGMRKTKQKSSLKKRTTKNFNSHSPYFEEEQTVYPVRSQVNNVPQMIVILDGDKAETAIIGQAA